MIATINLDQSQAKYLWFELMKCKKICKKHNKFWHTWAINEKIQLQENLILLEILYESKKIAKEIKKISKLDQKKIRKPLVKDAAWRKHRSDTERIRRANLRKTNPKWHKKNLKEQKKYYRKNPGPQIASSTKWNQEHKDRKNANNRASYARNADAINARRKKLRKAKKYA